MRDELFRNFEQGTQPARSSLEPNARPSDVGGLTRGGGETRAVADWNDLPRLGATENSGPPCNLPESVPASQIAAENQARWGNVASQREAADE